MSLGEGEVGVRGKLWLNCGACKPVVDVANGDIESARRQVLVVELGQGLPQLIIASLLCRSLLVVWRRQRTVSRGWLCHTANMSCHTGMSSSAMVVR